MISNIKPRVRAPRAFFILLFCCVCLIVGGSLQGARAEIGCPVLKGKTIRWIIPYSPGGGYDVYSRLFAPFFAKQTGARVRPENISGGRGVVGARTLINSKPDGLSVALINTSGMLAATVTGMTSAPNPAKDFSILGRLSSITDVLVTGAKSPIRTMDDVYKIAEKRPVIFSVSGTGGTSFVYPAISSELLAIKAEYVAGYRGTRQSSLAVMRGEVDMTSMPFSSARSKLESGELRAVLQLSSAPISPIPSMKEVPVLGGPNGQAAVRAKLLGRDVKKAVEDAEALIGLCRSGRVVVAPPGLDPKLRSCMEKSLLKAMADPDFIKASKKANRPTQPGSGEEALAGIKQSMAKAKSFAPIVEAAIAKVRK
jgi:tripartite-type tricarboxylate transporter receptor subunit TctC